jgi:ArsR family transcriptional regulator
MTENMTCDGDIINIDIVNLVREKMPENEEFFYLEGLFKIFSDTTRLKILYALTESELCVCDISGLLGMTNSAVSHQLKLLRMAKLVRTRRDGKVIYYSIADSHVETILATGIEHISE